VFVCVCVCLCVFVCVNVLVCLGVFMCVCVGVLVCVRVLDCVGVCVSHKKPTSSFAVFSIPRSGGPILLPNLLKLRSQTGDG